MGYYTSFNGTFLISPQPTKDQVNYLEMFLEQRFMKLHALEAIANESEESRELREAVGLPAEPQFLIVEDERSPMIADYNNSGTWPSLWCPWEVYQDRKDFFLYVSEQGKHYEFVEWLGVLINRILVRLGLTLSGTVTWHGEDDADFGEIEIVANSVYVREGGLSFSERQYVGGVPEPTQNV